MEELNIQYLKTADLLPYARNARKHSEKQVVQIAASIREFGFNTPCLIDDKNMLIAGHGRLLAAQKLDIDRVPCIRLDHLSEIQAKAYNLVDNQLAVNAEWDMDLLSLEVQELDNMEFDVDLLGFEDMKLKELLAQNLFEPGSENEQGQLDEQNTTFVMCPNCGEEFDEKEGKKRQA